MVTSNPDLIAALAPGRVWRFTRPMPIGHGFVVIDAVSDDLSTVDYHLVSPTAPDRRGRRGQRPPITGRAVARFIDDYLPAPGGAVVVGLAESRDPVGGGTRRVELSAGSAVEGPPPPTDPQPPTT